SLWDGISVDGADSDGNDHGRECVICLSSELGSLWDGISVDGADSDGNDHGRESVICLSSELVDGADSDGNDHGRESVICLSSELEGDEYGFVLLNATTIKCSEERMVLNNIHLQEKRERRRRRNESKGFASNVQNLPIFALPDDIVVEVQG
nr:hypothetical protein [Tanacetum cinerariifolium]